jgi:preprotein translocase subunit YajC
MDYSMFIILAVFVVFIIFSNRRRKNAAQQLESSVKVGANVVLAGGITGKIVEIRDTTVIVESTPGVKVEVLKGAVTRVLAPSLDEKKPATAKPVAKAAAKPATSKKPVSKTAEAKPAVKTVKAKSTK